MHEFVEEALLACGVILNFLTAPTSMASSDPGKEWEIVLVRKNQAHFSV